MTKPERLHVTWIPQAESAGWMAGMDLSWPHRALLMWTPLDPDGEGPAPSLRRALWQTLSMKGAALGVPVETATRPVGLFGWLFGQPRRAEFAMDWSGSFAAFDAAFDESLYFAATFDPDAPRPEAKDLAVWHDQGDPPETLFPAGQRAVVRSGVDTFCLGIFCRDEATLTEFRRALAEGLAEAGATLTDGPEPTSN